MSVPKDIPDRFALKAIITVTGQATILVFDGIWYMVGVFLEIRFSFDTNTLYTLSTGGRERLC